MAGKVILLFGAGASHGSRGCSPRPPPLASQLYDVLVKRYPKTWNKLPRVTKKLFESGFESGMGKVFDEARDEQEWNLADFQKDMARYFSIFRIGRLSDNSYYQLVTRYLPSLTSREIIFSTINYDCLIEKAIEATGAKVAYVSEHEGVVLLKIHGSCTFIPMHNVFIGGEYKQFGGHFDSSLQVVPTHLVDREIRRQKVQPAMRLFTKKKDILVGGTLLEQILKEFHSSIDNAKLIIVVGVRPNPEDTHIWDHLRDSKGKVVLLSPDSTCGEWIEEFRKGKDSQWYKAGFVDGYNRLYEEIDLILR